MTVRARGIVLVLVLMATQAGAAGIVRAQTASPFMCGFGLLSPTTETEAGVSRLQGALAADLDGDGGADQITGDGRHIYVTYRGPAATLHPQVRYGEDGQTALLIAAGNLDGTAGAELVVARATTVEIVKTDAAGALRVLATLPLASPSIGAAAAWTGQFRVKGTVDLLLPDETGALALYAGSPTGVTRIQSVTALPFSPLGGPVMFTTAVADMDSDGLDDFVFPVDRGVAVGRLGNRSAWDVFKTVPLPQGRTRYTAAAVGDFNGDGRRDLLVEPADSGVEPSPLNTWLQTATGDLTPIPDVAAGSWTWAAPILVGDLDGDGRDDFVAKEFVGRLSGETWVLSRFSVQVPISLFDRDGDGLLDYTAQGRDLHLVHAHASRADLDLAPGNLPTSVDAAGPLVATLVVTNKGPTATRGLSLGTSLSFGRFTVPGCADPAAGCPDVVLGANQSLTVTLAGTASLTSSVLDVSACSGAPDPLAANNTVHVPLAVVDVADLGATVGGQFYQNAFTVSAGAGNGGPSGARDLTLTVNLPPSSDVKHVKSDPAATCNTEGTTVTCALDALDAQKAWTLMLDGGFAYRGQGLSLTATVTSTTKDPNLGNNTFTLKLPSLPSAVGHEAGLGGCGCALGGNSDRRAAGAFALAAAMALVLGARRTRRRRPGRSLPSSPSSLRLARSIQVCGMVRHLSPGQGRALMWNRCQAQQLWGVQQDVPNFMRQTEARAGLSCSRPRYVSDRNVLSPLVPILNRPLLRAKTDYRAVAAVTGYRGGRVRES